MNVFFWDDFFFFYIMTEWSHYHDLIFYLFIYFFAEAVRSAVDHLELLGAVERREEQVSLTALGKKMANFPLEPRYAKVKHNVVR